MTTSTGRGVKASGAFEAPSRGDAQPSALAAAITVRVIYARPDAVWQKTLFLPMGATAGQAVAASGFAQAFPDYFRGAAAIGVYGQACSPDKVLNDGDRVELYRPLVFDAMESRRRRAMHRKAFMIKARNRPKRRKAKLAAAAVQAGLDNLDAAGAK